MSEPAEGYDFNRLARTNETMLRLIRDDDLDAALTIWNGLDAQAQRMVFVSLAKMVNHLRTERGDDPDSLYGPSETRGL